VQSVYSAVRTESLYIKQIRFVFKGLKFIRSIIIKELLRATIIRSAYCGCMVKLCLIKNILLSFLMIYHEASTNAEVTPQFNELAPDVQRVKTISRQWNASVPLQNSPSHKHIMLAFGRAHSVYDFQRPLEFLNFNLLNCKALHILRTSRDSVLDTIHYFGCGPDDQGSTVRFPATAENLSLLQSVQTGCKATQPPIQWVPRDSSPAIKRSVPKAYTQFHLVLKLRMSADIFPLFHMPSLL
jgi:hypothetical protein